MSDKEGMDSTRLSDSMWRQVGESLERALECGIIPTPGKPHISMFDDDQADQRKAISQKAKDKWANRPITYTNGKHRPHPLLGKETS